MADHSHGSSRDESGGTKRAVAFIQFARDHLGTMLLQLALDQTAALRAAPQGTFSAAQWVQQVLVGPLGTSLAVIAVASFGFALLAGRLSLKRGGLLVLGCFMLFGAPGLARALIGLAQATNTGSAPLPPQQITVPPPPVAADPAPFDPYAGASVPNAGN